MKVEFEQKINVPKISFILLDWSCRESFHMLKYLNDQTIARDQYEILWIEYYNRRSSEIREYIESAQRENKPPVIDQWIVMEMPEDTYYHKHLMYNVGLVKSRGDIVVICDSDVMVRPTFVESILQSFEKNPNQVLHLDEVRNNDRRFYPFNFPSFEEIEGKGSINWRHGKTIGLLETRDVLHKRNYGACFCAKREDLIQIGGADESMDYLGHICGPYELTFRLTNAGKKEVWHEREFLYHTWHPGTDDRGNYLGPHDGRNVSSTALNIRRTGRVRPLVENSAVRMLRRKDLVQYVTPEECLIPHRALTFWKRDRLKSSPLPFRLTWRTFFNPLKLWSSVQLFFIFIQQTFSQIFKKTTTYTPSLVMKKSISDHFYLGFAFIRRMIMNNFYTIQACREVLNQQADRNVKEVAIFGSGATASILKILARHTPLRVTGNFSEKQADALKHFEGKVIVASMDGDLNFISELEKHGILPTNIVRIQ